MSNGTDSGARADLKRLWNLTPLPARREPLAYQASFNAADTDRLIRGFEPREMEYKWLIYFDSDWLYFHRSWTGFCIYALHLRRSESGCSVEATWVNRDPDQYSNWNTQLDLDMLDKVIHNNLLGRLDARRFAPH